MKLTNFAQKNMRTYSIDGETRNGNSANFKAAILFSDGFMHLAQIF